MTTTGDFSLLAITVPHVSLKRGSNGGSLFAVFEIKVEANCSGQRLQWTHHRRYTDFMELHRKLSQLGFAGLPELPGKRLMNNLAEQFLQKRRAQLESYLQQTTNSPEASTCPSFMNFIGAVQFIDTSEANRDDNMTNFPYAMRSGRYARTKPARATDVDTCKTCVIC